MADDRTRIDELIANLDQPDKPKIRVAVDALTPLAAESEDLRSRLESLLNSEGIVRRWPIAYILGQLSHPSGSAIRALLDGLDHGEPDIRWAIALLLIRIAKEHGEVITLLIGLAREGTVNQKRMAIYCLRDLHLTDPESLGAIIAALGDSDATVRVAAATSLRLRADIEANGREKLLDCFVRDEDLRVRNAAAVALAQLGSPSQAFVTALQAASAGENAQLKKAAAAALAILEIAS